MSAVRKVVLFFKSHVEGYTRRDGVVVKPHERYAMAGGRKVAVTRNGGYVEDAGQWTPHGKRAMQAVFDHGSKEKALEHLKASGDQEAHDALAAAGDITVHDDEPKPAKPEKDWRDEENWHSRTMGRMKTLGEAELRYIIKDATEAAELGEKSGWSSEKTGKYRDEAHYAAMELHKRGQALNAKAG